MIRVPSYPAPTNYIADVLKPGNAYLKRYPNPTPHQFKKHSFWSAIHPELYHLYGGICSYCASWTPRSPNVGAENTSVDHFIPKSIQPNSAYDWENFRLCRARLNTKKGNALHIIDPLGVPDGWFILDFSTFLIQTSSDTPVYAIDRVNGTIDTLGLNENDYVNERIGVIKLYSCDQCVFAYVQRRYPFIANEMVRINFDQTLKSTMKTLFNR